MFGGPGITAKFSFRALCFCVTAVSLGAVSAYYPVTTLAQQGSETAVQEVVANLAAGRVIIAVVKDAIVIGTIENPIEPETRPPTPVALSSARMGTILGPVYWFSPSSQEELASLDAELPHLRSGSVPGALAPHLQQSQAGSEANDIEAEGDGLLLRLNAVAKNLRGKLDNQSKGPLAELIVADYLNGYGAEVWQMTYEMKQVETERDYWDTHFLRPTYSQFWPPEKGQPKTLIEFAYPIENSPTPLLELLRQNDATVEKLISANPQMAAVSKLLLQGESTKIVSADAVAFLRAAMNAIAKPNERQTLAMIGQESGIQWIIAPPPETRKKPQSAAALQTGESSDRPADAPSLLHSPSH